jgi:hypothetical protein
MATGRTTPHGPASVRLFPFIIQIQYYAAHRAYQYARRTNQDGNEKTQNVQDVKEPF